jgi:hypothetical protein
MGAFTDLMESGVLNHLFRSVTLNKPSHIGIGLVSTYNATNLEKGLFSEELSGGGYTRQTVNADASTWITPYPSGTAQALHNMQDIKFPQATADIGNVEGVFLTDSDAGTMLFYGQLTAARNIRSGDQFVFASGSLKITVD